MMGCWMGYVSRPLRFTCCQRGLASAYFSGWGEVPRVATRHHLRGGSRDRLPHPAALRYPLACRRARGADQSQPTRRRPLAISIGMAISPRMAPNSRAQGGCEFGRAARQETAATAHLVTLKQSRIRINARCDHHPGSRALGQLATPAAATNIHPNPDRSEHETATDHPGSARRTPLRDCCMMSRWKSLL
jgi:hypothetical protein